jgi:environmental stress-induced protein Ves
MAVILRAADRAAVPWKNGGGLTREVAVCPRGSTLEDFEWRVSLAEIHRRGPFSAFPGVDRQMAVLAGRLTLAIDEAETLTLSPDSPPLGFRGEARVVAEPLGRPVTDLNVMTRRGRRNARLRPLAMHTAQHLALKADATVVIALSELTLRWQASQQMLSRFDALLCNGAAQCEVVPSRAGAGEGVSLYLAEISAQQP